MKGYRMKTTRVWGAPGAWYCRVAIPEQPSREHGPFATKREALELQKSINADVRKHQPQLLRSRPGRRPMGNVPSQIPMISDEEAMEMINEKRPMFDRRNVSDLEFSEVVQEMTLNGIKQTAMADHLGRHQTWFSFMYRLSQLPEDLKDLLRQDMTRATAVVRGVDLYGEALTQQAAKEILRDRRLRGIHGNRPRITERDMMDMLEWLSSRQQRRA